MNLLFKAKQKIVFFGDSITDADHQLNAYQPLGQGYVRQVHNLLQAGYPELNLEIINRGISGDQITNLLSRYEKDVRQVNPDWLFIYIGINDAWRHLEGKEEDNDALRAFQNNYRTLIEKIRSTIDVKLRLVSPFLAEKDRKDPFRQKLSHYQTILDDLGAEFEVTVIHLQRAFDWAMLSRPAAFWSADRVHPTDEGHMLIALTLLRACGFRL